MSYSLTDSTNTGIGYFQAGKLEQASQIFESILVLQKDNAEALHLLGVVKQQQGDIETAVGLLKRAVSHEKGNVIYLANLCNALIEAESWVEAEANCKTIIALDPKYSVVYYHYARLCFATQRFVQVIEYCLQAIDLNSDNGAARMLLAQAYLEQKEWLQAQQSYEFLIGLYPDSAQVLYGLGLSSQQLGDYVSAEIWYKKALAEDSGLSEAYNALGCLYFNQGQLQKSFSLFYQAIKKDPANVDAHFNQALVLRGLGKLEDSLSALQSVLDLQPKHFQALASAGLNLQDLGRDDQAKDYYQKVLQLDPGNSLAKHLLSALRGESATTAPTEFVANLFDSYAPVYESHLQSVLEFSVPSLIKTAIHEYCTQQLPFASGLDLGCGTGLLGAALGPMVEQLDGVDLSENMLKIAEAKECYRDLGHTDILSFVSNTTNRYDCCLACDVFIYSGDLEDIFVGIHNILKKNGVFVFSCEQENGETYSLQSNGRFAHSVDYITALLNVTGFSLLKMEAAKLRKEQELWISGYIYILQKK